MHKSFVGLAALGGPLLLAGCATIFEGTSQSVAIATDPPGADCTIDRKGARVGQVNPTPGSIHLDKSKEDLAVLCRRPGYQTATVSHSPKFQGTTFGNIIAGGLIGVAVDAASGANFSYPTEIRVTMAADAIASPPLAVGPSSRTAAARIAQPAAVVAVASRDFVAPASLDARLDLLVRATDLDATAAGRLRVVPAQGVLLREVITGGAAAQAGMQADDVIVTFNGAPITGMNDLQRELGRVGRGAQVSAVVWRDNRQTPITLRF